MMEDQKIDHDGSKNHVFENELGSTTDSTVGFSEIVGHNVKSWGGISSPSIRRSNWATLNIYRFVIILVGL